ncbi:glycosyltransferase [Marinilabilia rubra]|uniref:Glycosyl transferase group 1 n=1 Tax=Marinilabilia rubra TaxID=2162893 RepID=A0A2U2B3E0_9BACT|nr:glycosyltransferase [Marinilabilia rubra]PWD97579.1 glycosyl transferase group 1 [Marinilabilia rubra]
MKKAIITTSNNLVYDNRVHKITLSLMKLGLDVYKTGRNYPKTKPNTKRPGHEKRFNLPFKNGPLFYAFLNIYTFFFLLFKPYDIIWAVDMDTLPAARLACYIKKKPVVFDSHEYFSESPELKNRKRVKKIWRFLEKTFIPGADFFITVSPGLIKLYKQNMGLDFTLVRNLPLKNKQNIHPLLKSDTPTILYQGALNLGRGISQTIEAMQFLPGYKFIIVGRGDCTRELKKLSKELNLEDQVNFVGAVPFEKLPKYQKGVLLGMCIHEKIGLNYYYALPNRLFDFIQAGIPVICNDFPDMSAVVSKYNTGLIIENLTPKLLAEKIKEACEDTELRKQWQKSISNAAQQLTWENEEIAIKKIFDLLL